MLKKILIANRGEIACRIIKTARAMGITTVTIYTEIDKNSLHVTLADAAFCVENYLNIPDIIEAAKFSASDAIHPGYGFLSENVELASACIQANLIWIGPPIAAMDAMASKQRAKQHVATTNVPIIPGYYGLDQDNQTLLKQAQFIGFPVIIKAALGGGGKGMRTVYHQDDLLSALDAARREALASFADQNLLLEKYLERARHLEVQIMADNYGNVSHLSTRDCSIQRRHQKIIEEAPALAIDENLYQQLTNAAITVARSINYQGAGTIEFLVDEHQNFYFMEMNTRLQVEHTVTEMITNIDLVEWQLRIAANEQLSLPALTTYGHAIECRVYAEDPHKEFLPSVGKITYLEQPQNVRIDTGIRLGSQISQYYDPLISKVIAWGGTRQEAIAKLQQALDNYYIDGIKTNLIFLQEILHNELFTNTPYYTNFLEKALITLPKPDHNLLTTISACFDYLELYTNQDALIRETIGYGLTSWNLNYLIDDQVYSACVHPINANTVKINDQILNTHKTADFIFIHDGKQTTKYKVRNSANKISIYTNLGTYIIERVTELENITHHQTNNSSLTAPIPSTIVAILKNIGDIVIPGEKLMILEAMKMEHAITACSHGAITNIFYNVGEQVAEGVELISMLPTTC